MPLAKKQGWGNGDGRFLYPPESNANGRPVAPVLDAPVDSIRWELLRDGIEDYEYLVMLQRALKKNKQLPKEKRHAYEALLEVPPDISRRTKKRPGDEPGRFLLGGERLLPRLSL